MTKSTIKILVTAAVALLRRPESTVSINAKHNPKKSWLLLSALVCLLTSNAQAALTIEITQGIDAAIPIAIVPFEDTTSGLQTDTDIARVIAADLRRSGRFLPMASEALPQTPHKERDVNFNLWRRENIESLVVGRIKPIGSGYYEISVELLDVFKGPQEEGKERFQMQNGDLVIVRDHILAAQSYHIGQKDLRKVAHHISDLIYEKLTGEKGAFSTQIIYVSVDRSSPSKPLYRLELADSDGFNPRTLMQSEEPILSPAWSPNSKQVAYVSYEQGKPEIFVQTIASGYRHKITEFDGLNSAPAWAPNGNELAVTLSKDGNPEIYIINIDTKKLQRITNNHAIDTEPQFSPDGKKILFTSDRGGKPQLYEYDRIRKRTKRLTFDGDYNARGRYLPDGSGIVMVHRQKGKFHIAHQEFTTGALYSLTKTELDESPSIAPNGSMVIYGTLFGNRGVLSAVSIDGRVKLRLPSQAGEVREPAWSPFLR